MGATQAKSSIQRSTLSAKWKRLTTRRNCATPPPAAPPLERAKSLKYPRQKTLAPMPRCSSFSGNAPDDGAPSLVAPTKKSLNDPSYTLWKTAFEEDWPELPLAWPHQQRTRTRIHDMSEAVAGQLTPKGFPSYTDLTRSSNGGSPLPAANKKPEVIYATVRRRLSLRLPKLNASRKQEMGKVEQQPIVPAEQKPVATAAHRPSIPPTANLAEKPAIRADNLAAKKQATISININILRTSNKDTTPKQAAAQGSVSNQQNMRKPDILLNHAMQPHRNVVSTTTTTKPQATLKPAVTTTSKPHFLSKLPKEQADVIEKLYLDIRAAECCGMPLNYYYL